MTFVLDGRANKECKTNVRECATKDANVSRLNAQSEENKDCNVAK